MRADLLPLFRMLQMFTTEREHPRAGAEAWLFAGARYEAYRALPLRVKEDAQLLLESLADKARLVLRPELATELRAIQLACQEEARRHAIELEGALRRAAYVRVYVEALRAMNTNPAIVDEARWFRLVSRKGLLLTITPGRQTNLPRGGEVTINKEYAIHRSEVLEAKQDEK